MVSDPADPRVAAIREATSLAELADGLGVATPHEAYFEAKPVWAEAVRRRQAARPADDGLPGWRVTVDGHAFHVHGVTHAGTDAERDALRGHVERFRDRGATVYCEQGIRPLYFEDFPAVCEMDDYRWALRECADRDVETHLDALSETGVDAVLEDLTAAADRFREAVFSLVESGGAVYGDRFERALGDVAAGFLTDHAAAATGESYEAFRLSNAAAEDPERLGALMRYYERAFLPQPLEREWLRGHDPELELVSHARNERMADYAVYHNEAATEVHLIVGAAHAPGVRYYLRRLRDGAEVPDDFAPL
ncbi:hypothetical protein GCM10027435_21820 [Haloparvum alkalitolerans]|uniref:hypothetical protein n=1 Tax=Haloparvum alkalitolerans TaxID=1042953 RepID=UPI003CEBE819